MKVRFPRTAVILWEAFTEWGDVPIYRHGNIVVRRIDTLIAMAGTVCVGYYGWTGGWYGALAGALAFTFVALIALWL